MSISLISAVILSFSPGCAEPKGPCGTPPIYRNDDPIDEETEASISRMVEEIEEFYPPLTCNVNQIEIYSDEDLAEISEEDAAGAWIKDQDHTVALSESTITLEQSSENSLPDLSKSGKKTLLHEFVHSRQDVRREDWGFSDFEEEFGGDENYGQYGSEDFDISRFLSDHASENVGEDHAEVISWWRYRPEAFFYSSHPSFLSKTEFAEAAWGEHSFLPEYPDHVNVSVSPTPPSGNLEIVPYDRKLAKIEVVQYGSTVIIHSHQGEENLIRVQTEEIDIPFTGFVAESSISFAEDKMVFVGSDCESPCEGYPATHVGIFDLTSGELISTEFSPPDHFPESAQDYHTTIYDGELLVLPEEITLSEDTQANLEALSFNLNNGLERDPKLITTLDTQFDPESPTTSFRYCERSEDNTFFGIETPDNFLIWDLENDHAIGSIDYHSYYMPAVDSTGTITYFNLIYDLYTEELIPLLLKGSLESGMQYVFDSNLDEGHIQDMADGWLTIDSSFSVGESSFFLFECTGSNCEDNVGMILETR